MLRVIQNLYRGAKAYIKNMSQCSSTFHCDVGVRQGDCLSPILFAVYLNDLKSYLQDRTSGLGDFFTDTSNVFTDADTFAKLFLFLYADDTVLLEETPLGLQRSLDALGAYCCKWHLKVNTTKTKIVIFSRGKVRIHPDFCLSNEKIEVVSDYKYLGVIFNYNGKFSKTIVEQSKRASQAMFNILKQRCKLNLDIETMFKLFDTCVLPIATYGCEVWGFESLLALEKLHLRFCKILLNLKRSTCNPMVYGETGRYPVSCIVYDRMVRFWYNLSNSRTQKLSQLTYRYLFLSNAVYNPWLETIKNIFCLHGLNNIWLSQAQSVEFTWLTCKVQLILRDTFQQHWLSEIQMFSKCSNYKFFKIRFGYESYLHLLQDDLRLPLCRFRCRNSKIPVENYHVLNLDDKNCKLCNLNTEGDEYHYLLICPFFEYERKKFVPKYFYTYPSIEKMECLLNRGLPHVSKIAKFVKIIAKVL